MWTFWTQIQLWTTNDISTRKTLLNYHILGNLKFNQCSDLAWCLPQVQCQVLSLQSLNCHPGCCPQYSTLYFGFWQFFFPLVCLARPSFPLHPLAGSAQVDYLLVHSQPSNTRPLQSTNAHGGKICPIWGQDVALREEGGELKNVGAAFGVGQPWPWCQQPQSRGRIFARQQVTNFSS